MKKENQSVFIMSALLLLAVVVGWFLMDGLLSAKEQKILSRSGQVTISSVIGNDKTVSEDGKNHQGKFTEKVLSEEEIAEVLSVWETGGRKIPHEPLEGQMNMEQAIAKGKWWIANMTRAELLPDDILTGTTYSANAKLYIPENESNIGIQKLGMWEVTYKKENVKIDLKIHAWSGEVWEAEISMDSELALYREVEEKKLSETAFSSFAWRDGSYSVYYDDDTYCEKGRNGSVYISVLKYESAAAYNRVVSCVRLWLETEPQN